MITLRKAALLVVLVTALSGYVRTGTADAQTDISYRWGAFGLAGEANHESATPSAVGSLTNIVAMAAGNASDMALDSAGNVWTWGDGTNGVLGNGSTAGQITSPVKVPGLPPIVGMAESDNTDVAVDAGGNVWGWGWNHSGQLCTGNATQFTRPVELTALSGVAVAAGAGGHMLYLLSNGTLKACGDNRVGELGNGTFTSSTVPVTVTGFPASRIASITAGQVDSTALLGNGQVWDWGWNAYGQLGNNVETNANVPVQVALPGPASQVYEGGDSSRNGQSLALLRDGTVWGWGNNAFGQLGNGTTNTINATPVMATGLPPGLPVVYVVSGGTHGLALDATGSIWAWGNNDEGQVGGGLAATGVLTATVVLTPTVVLQGANMISATADDSLAHVPILQTIAFTSGPPANASVGGPSYTVSATGGGSGLPVTFSVDSATSSVCTIAGSTVSFIGLGTCTIDAHQGGNVIYGAAAQVQQSFAVTVVPRAITSAVTANAATGIPFSFRFTTMGAPAPSFTQKGSVPRNLRFIDNGDGTATLSGTPRKGGTYRLTVTATFGTGSDRTIIIQGFTLTVR